jgi:hypothetical protein
MNQPERNGYWRGADGRNFKSGFESLHPPFPLFFAATTLSFALSACRKIGNTEKLRARYTSDSYERPRPC